MSSLKGSFRLAHFKDDEMERQSESTNPLLLCLEKTHNGPDPADIGNGIRLGHYPSPRYHPDHLWPVPSNPRTPPVIFITSIGPWRSQPADLLAGGVLPSQRPRTPSICSSLGVSAFAAGFRNQYVRMPERRRVRDCRAPNLISNPQTEGRQTRVLLRLVPGIRTSHKSRFSFATFESGRDTGPFPLK